MSDSFATILGALFLIDEAPYVDVKSHPTLSSAKTGRSEITRLRFIQSSLAIGIFPAISLKTEDSVYR